MTDIAHIWNDDDELLVAFSVKKPELFADDFIPGINVGMNTGEPEERILEKRAYLLAGLGINTNQVVLAHQVHSTEIHYATDPETVEGADGFVTDRKNLALAIQVADCAAVFMADRENRVIGAAHAGWRGAADNIISRTIEMMHEKGARISNLESWIGPCIGTDRFEVGEEVACHFSDEFILRESYRKPHINLKGVVRRQLEDCGITRDRIYVDPGCTYEEPELYYSFRREKERSGRMMGLIMLR